MTKAKIVHLVYEIVLGLLAIAVGICFIVSCISIYQGGDNPFTRDSISAHFQSISIPVYIFLALIVGGVVLNIACPKEKKRNVSTVDKALVLENLYKRFPLCQASEGKQQQIRRQHYIRMTLNIVFAVSLIASIIFCLAYLLDPNSITESPNETVIKGVLAMLIYLIIPAVLSIVMVFVFKSSYEKELAFLKSAMVEAKKGDPVSKNVISEEESKGIFSRAKAFFEKHRKIIILVAQLVVLTVALVLLITGIINGGVQSVLAKANKLCQECIGIG